MAQEATTRLVWTASNGEAVNVTVPADSAGSMLGTGGYRLADGETVDSGDGRPKRNASTEVWAAYAQERDVSVPEGASRDEIVAAVEAAGV